MNLMKQVIQAALRKIGYRLSSIASVPKDELTCFFEAIQRLGFAPHHIIDVGANRGNWTRSAIRFFPKAQYTLVEPQDQLKAHIQDLLDRGHKIRWVNAAVGDKPGIIEGALRDDLARRMGAGFDKNRFVPFVTMHEFESLLFSNCSAFARGIGRSKLEGAFQKIRDQFESPEEIDDSPQTAPSKRVEVLVPDYEKPLHGTLAALEVGLESMREECPHFDQWLTDLEGRHGA